MSPDQLAALVADVRPAVTDEKAVQECISAALTAAGIDHQREAPVAGGIIDILAGEIGIEVKVKGSQAAVLRQLQRYAHTPGIRHLVLATTRPGHRTGAPATIGNTPLTVAVITGGAW